MLDSRLVAIGDLVKHNGGDFARFNSFLVAIGDLLKHNGDEGVSGDLRPKGEMMDFRFEMVGEFGDDEHRVTASNVRCRSKDCLRKSSVDDACVVSSTC